MRICGPSARLIDVTSLDESRLLRSACLVDVYYEELTPEVLPNGATGDYLISEHSGRPQSLRPTSVPPPPPRQAFLVPPPAAPRSESVRVPTTHVLLPEMAHDPHYYPGLVPAAHERSDVSFDEPAPRRRWHWQALAGATLFAAGLVVARWQSGPVPAPQPPAGRPRGTAPVAVAALPVAQPPVAEPPVTEPAPTSAAPDNEVAEPEPSAAEPAIAAAPSPEPAVRLSRKELAKRHRSEVRAARVLKRYLARKARRGGTDVAAPTVAAESTAAPAAVASGATGTLQINSRPWSDVSIDGRMVGHTPQMALQLSPGRHTVKLTNASMGLSKTLTVTIRSGETVKQIETLGQ